MKINVDDVFYLLDLDEKPLKALDVDDYEREKIFEGMNEIRVTLPLEQEIVTEQQIVFRKERYIIEDIEESRTSSKKNIEASSAIIELNYNNLAELEFTSLDFESAMKRITNGSGWEIGHIDDDNDRKYSMSEEDISRLYGARKLSNVADFFLVPDTINRILNFYKSSGKYLDFILRYGKNIKDIKRIITSPKATELIPIGKGGLSIESVNDGKEYIEDYSWYESLGIPYSEAKSRFKKRHTWKNETFVYAGNLMRSAEKKLRELAHPQIAYETEVLTVGKDVDVGDYGYIVDDELDIKVQVRVVRLLEYEDETKNKIELNYFVKGLESLQEDMATSDSGGNTEMIATYNDSRVILNSNFQTAIELAFTSYAPTNMQIGVTITGNASSDLLLDGYFDIQGNRVGRQLKQQLKQGWNTISMNFLILQVAEGSEFLNLMLRAEGGTFEIEAENIELYIVAQNLLGGMSARLPRANWVDDVTFIDSIIVDEENIIIVDDPKRTNIIENVEFLEHFNVTDIPSIIFDGIDYNTEPPSTPTGINYTFGYNAITLEWEPNTEDDLAGYNVYLDDVRVNREVIFEETWYIPSLQNGQTYNIKITAIDVWNNESEPYEFDVELPELELPIYFPLPSEVQNYDNWIIVNRIDEIILYAVNGEVKTNYRDYNVASSELGWMSWWWTDEGWVFRSDSSTLYLGTNDVDQDGFILTSHDIKDDITEEVVFWGYQGEVTFE